MHAYPHAHPRRRRRSAAAVAAVLTVVVMAGCAGPANEDEAGDPTRSSDASTPSNGTTTDGSTSTPTAPAGEPTSEPTRTAEVPTGPTLAVTIDGDAVGPNAAEIDLAVGEPLVISFKTDRGGQLHVHSKPEQFVDFGAGTSTQELTVTTPGTVEIEEHDTEAVVAVLQVR